MIVLRMSVNSVIISKTNHNNNNRKYYDNHSLFPQKGTDTHTHTHTHTYTHTHTHRNINALIAVGVVTIIPASSLALYNFFNTESVIVEERSNVNV